MMTLGRLRAIESYWARIKPENFGHPVVSTACKHTAELFDEVKRLRSALRYIAEHRHEDAGELSGTASEALREPDLGKPDIVCRDAHSDGERSMT